MVFARVVQKDKFFYNLNRSYFYLQCVNIVEIQDYAVYFLEFLCSKYGNGF
jgi:hypothetical protein